MAYRMDATEDDGSFWRHINDSIDRRNCKVKVKKENQKTVFVFLALRDIDIGEEILYNYGPGNTHGGQRYLEILYTNWYF
jgi:SET domain-containing protein